MKAKPENTAVSRGNSSKATEESTAYSKAVEWRPSWWGRQLTRSPDWCLRLEDFVLKISFSTDVYQVDVSNTSAYSLRAGLFWTEVTLHAGGRQEIKVDGLPNVQGANVVRALDFMLRELNARSDVEFVRDAHRKIDAWLRFKDEQEQAHVKQPRWFSHETQNAVLELRPNLDATDIRSRLKKPIVAVRLGSASQEIEISLSKWESDFRAAWAVFNAAHVERELMSCKSLFDNVESKPLTDEQSRAVVCFDNRVQVVASAGSGKTSVMVAKAAYAIQRELIAPQRIVLLAFNKKAADELKERMTVALGRLGMADVVVQASTFHAMGLELIGKATGEKPEIPEWATDAASGVRKLAEIVDRLKDSVPLFRRQWDLFRFVFGRDLPAFGAPNPSDVWDAQGTGALLTCRGERVKSLEEAMIANFLFLNGVEYQYEASYPHRTADESHRQYHPDFFYPELDLFHEHFALDANGMPPARFENYSDGVTWKRKLHAAKGTDLFETTSHGLRRGDDLLRLERELVLRGLVLDPNPDRAVPLEGQKPLESIELIGLMRTFLSHAKSNGLKIADLQKRLDEMPEETFKYRNQIFLDLAAPILSAWDESLKTEGGIDFEDMLNLAAEYVEAGRVTSPYDLIMADEFQDASRSRARLCRALVSAPNRYFFAVGDDWQSINRFAGADVSVMTDFLAWFGHGQVLRLERTFRCPQALCDVSSSFVSKNPTQITKRVQSETSAHGPVLQAFQVAKKEELADAVDQYVMQLAVGVRGGTVTPGRNGRVSVYVLGRYNADRQYVPANPDRFSRWVDVSFLTIHRSKGSEADYVILPEMISAHRRRSFPNTRTDDPVLALAMPDGDSFPLGEERRLFYVALTRARRSVAMFTARGQCSTFLRELVEDEEIIVHDTDGQVVEEEACPACGQGVLVLRTGPYGDFQSCSSFPTCRYKPKRQASPSSLSRNHTVNRIASSTYPRSPTQESADRPRLVALRAWRAEVAKAQSLPTYVIFHDATLAAIAARAPRSLQDLRDISGMGAHKLERYGKDVVRVCATVA